MQEWMIELRSLPKSRLRVGHNPLTARYSRASDKLSYILQSASVLGLRQESEVGNPVELAVWAPPQSGRGCGLYVCFRIWLGQEKRPVLAVLYCFYDGTEKSPCFRSFHSALEYAKEQGHK